MKFKETKLMHSIHRVGPKGVVHDTMIYALGEKTVYYNDLKNTRKRIILSYAATLE